MSSTSPSVLLVSAACGLCLGIGVAYGGMTDARKTSAFFNLTNLGTPFWDPTLGLMFAAALVANAALYHALVPRLAKPLLADKFSIPTRRDLPWQLFAGSAMFGAGWAIGGYCPGPAIVASFTGDGHTLLFVAAMMAAMTLFKYQSSPAPAPATPSDDKNAKAVAQGNDTPVVSSAVVSVAVVLTLAGVAWATAQEHAAHRTPEAHRSTFFLHPMQPAIGGVLIGTSVALMMILSGRILGISGIVSGLFSSQTKDKAFRAAFALGLLAAGLVVQTTHPAMLVNRLHRPWYLFVVGGALVGYGTSMGHGCTSGHGIAGLTRMSRRSILAVAVFFGANIATTTLLSTVGIGSGWRLALDL